MPQLVHRKNIIAILKQANAAAKAVDAIADETEIGRSYHATTTPSIDAVLETEIQNHRDIECLYVINGEGKQLSHTVMNPKIKVEQDENFRPALPGEDYSSKKYFRQAMKNKQELYTSPEYISKATGNLCKTISYAYQCDDKEYYVICIDLLCRF